MGENIKRAFLLPVVAVILALGLVVASYVVTGGIVSVKGEQKIITVTGSAKKQFKSDLIVWRGTFSSQSVQLTEAFSVLKNSMKKVKDYLSGKGIAEGDMVFSSISTNTNYVLSPNGMMTSQVESYRLYQTVEIKSAEVDKITAISREATELINSGVEFQSNPPEYFYTKIADLKIDMIGLATKDSKSRAEQIASSTGSKVGSLRSAKMGVFQITPLYSTMISDYGVNDTSSLEKEITAVMTCDFEITR